VARVKPLPRRSLPAVVAARPAYRQSMLGNVDNCALSARFEMEGHPITNAAQARGIIFHRAAAELLRTLARTGEVRIPTAEALEILYEASAQRNVPDHDVVVVPMRERRMLRIAFLALVKNEFNMTRLIDVERRLFADVSYRSERWHDCPDCRDGDSGCETCRDDRLVAGPGVVTRTVTGQPDALLADPPDGAIVLDWKTTPSAPPAHEPGRGRDPSEDHHGDHLHVSYEGYWQQRFYALLVMRNYPSVKHVTLREFYVLEKPGNKIREATVTREALEHVEREIADAVELLDRGLTGGSRSGVWSPSPGKHCAYCRRPTTCPIEREARVKEGGITSAWEAQRFGSEFVLADEVRTETREALKAWHEATGLPIPVKSAKGRYVLKWSTNTDGRRRFGLTVPAESDRGPEDANLAAAFAEAATRRAA
jgi:hypothetical protein